MLNHFFPLSIVKLNRNSVKNAKVTWSVHFKIAHFKLDLLQMNVDKTKTHRVILSTLLFVLCSMRSVAKRTFHFDRIILVHSIVVSLSNTIKFLHLRLQE